MIICNGPLLESENKAGRKKFWRISVVKDDGKFYTQTMWYQTTAGGGSTTHQVSELYYAEPTNVGRSNERGNEEQAYFEMDATIKKQMDKGYHEHGKRVQSDPLPMLAHNFADHGHKVTYPIYIQPKLNGMRMLFDGRRGWSRGNKPIIPEVIHHLRFETDGHILDGELILPQNVLLQDTMSAVKKYRKGISDRLLYYVYDVVEPDMPYKERLKLLETLFKKNGFSGRPEVDGTHGYSPAMLTTTIPCDNETDVVSFHKAFVEQGFEGSIIRDNNTGYQIGKRSYSLLKKKDMQDAEFKIIRVKEGAGKFKGSAIFVCVVNGTETVDCVMEGPMERRREMWENRKDYIGKFLTIRYQELSKAGVPVFPIGVSIRDETDFE